MYEVYKNIVIINIFFTIRFKLTLYFSFKLLLKLPEMKKQVSY